MVKLHSFKCPKCLYNVLIDDIDYNFKGNEDDYCYCDNCNVNFFIKVRYGSIISVSISREDEDFYFSKSKNDFVKKE